MIRGSQTISNSTQSFSDYRYQKALKEISKLIAINRQIKIESESLKHQYQQIFYKNSQLASVTSNLQKQNKHLRDQLQTLTLNFSQLEDYYKKLQYDQQQLLKQNQDRSQNRNQIQSKQNAQFQKLENNFKQQMNAIMTEIHTRDQTINELKVNLQYMNQLQLENDKLHQSYQSALKQNAEKDKKISQLNEMVNNTSNKVKQQSNEDLLNKLKINEEWIKSLNEENYALKQKVIEQEYKKQKEKCNETILKNVKDAVSLMNVTFTNPNEFLIKQYQKQVQRKFKKLEDEKIKLQNKYGELKKKYNEVERKVNSYEKLINNMSIKLTGYEQLTQRQQKQLQEIVQEYHSQMDKVMSDKKRASFKNLQQSSQTNQPAVRQVQLKKLIQNLEKQIQQNKAQSQEKDKLIKFLEAKIDALENERKELQKVNQQLELSIAENQNMDLSKTSKNYNKVEYIIKNNGTPKNTGKAVLNNGKKYESFFLKYRGSAQSREEEEDSNGQVSMISGENKEQKKIIFSQGQIHYTSSQRSYGGNQWPVHNLQMA